MSEVPSGKDQADGADDLYRRASALDDSRPSELARRRVLDHAAQLAAERAAHKSAAATESVRAANRRWRRPAIFGTLAAAALAGLLITPRFLTPNVPPMAALPPRVALPSTATAMRASEAPARTVAAPAPNRTAEPAAPAAPAAAKSSPPRLQSMASLRSNAAASADLQAAGAPPQPGATMAAAQPSPDPSAELRRAAEAGDMAQLQTQLGKQPPIDARDESGRTALMLAVLGAQSQVVDVLLASGADPNAADARGTTPLQAAVAGNESGIATALRRAGAR